MITGLWDAVYAIALECLAKVVGDLGISGILENSMLATYCILLTAFEHNKYTSGYM